MKISALRHRQQEVRKRYLSSYLGGTLILCRYSKILLPGSNIILLFAIVVCMIATPAYAQVYRCELGGKISFQQTPCSVGKQKVIETNKPSEEDLRESTEVGGGLKIGVFSIKFEKPDHAGDYWFAYKVGITNKSIVPQKIRLTYNGVDREGFLIKEVSLRGTIPPNSYKILSNRTWMSGSEKRRIYKWELQK